MAILSLAFFACFFAAHAVHGSDSLAMELCFFRDGDAWAYGHMMFACLIAMGFILIRRLERNPNCQADSVVCHCALVLLCFVSMTSSYGALHFAASIVVLGGLFGYYACALNEMGHPWLRWHLATPILLLAIPPIDAFGPWQKGMVVYLVILMNAQYAALGAPAPRKRIVKRRTVRRRIESPAGSVFVRADSRRYL